MKVKVYRATVKAYSTIRQVRHWKVQPISVIIADLQKNRNKNLNVRVYNEVA